MGLFDGLFGASGGSPGGLYGDALTPEQKQALSYNGLLGFLGGMQRSGALDYTMPTITGKMPGGFAAGLAGGMAGMGEAQDKAALNALNAQLVSLKGQDLKSTLAARQKLMEILPGLAGGGGPASAPPATAVSPTPAAAGGPDTVVPSGDNWEITHNNFGGLRIPGSTTGPKSGGFQAFATPEDGLGAISRQLDRYASGATTGKPLTSLRQIVSTWAPPSENPTSTLIDRAAQVTGFDPDAQLNVSDPAVKAKLIEATIRNEQGGKLPVDSALIQKVAFNPSGPALTVGGGLPAVARGPTLAGATPGAADMSAIPPAAPGTALNVPGMPNATPAVPAGGPAAMPAASPVPLAPPPAGAAVSPPLINGIDPRALAAAGTFAQIGGMGDAVKPLETYYYNTPGYKGAVKGAEELAAAPFTDLFKASLALRQFPPGSPEYNLAQAAMAKAAGITPVLGGQRPNTPIVQFNNTAGRYELVQPAGYAEAAGNLAAATAGGAERGKEQARQTAVYGDLLTPTNPAFPMGTAMPGAASQGQAPAPPPASATTNAQPDNLPTGYQRLDDKSIWTPRGTVIPPIEKQTLPRSEAELKPYAEKTWPEMVDSWAAAAPLAEAAEQRTMAMIDSMKTLETQPFNTAKADISAKMRAMGLDVLADQVMSARDTSTVQFMIHNNVANSLATLKGVTSRFTQQEFKTTTQNSVNPDITPAANKEMAINDLAMVRNVKTLPQDWNDAQRFDKWRNPVSFAAERMQADPLHKQVESIRQEIGDMKGTTKPPDAATLNSARDAIARGAPRAAVIKMMQDKGLSADGL